MAPDTDAFFCGNDQIARGVTDILRADGHRVPDDIAVVGYDNWDIMALALRPPLTTVDMDLNEIGRIAALRLLCAIDGGVRASRAGWSRASRPDSVAAHRRNGVRCTRERLLTGVSAG